MSTITLPAAPTSAAGDRFVAFALLLLAATFVALQVIAGEVTPFWVMPTAVYLTLGLAVLRRASRWLLIVAVVVTVLQVASSAPYTIPGFSHPETPATFLPEVVIVVTSVAGVVGAVMALRGAERQSRRPIAALAALIITVAVVTSVVAALGVPEVAQQPGDVPVIAANVDYPERIEVQQGGVLWLRNQDAFRHTFVIEDTAVRIELPGSAAVRVDVDLSPGTYTFLCDVPGHEKVMRGVLHVQSDR